MNPYKIIEESRPMLEEFLENIGLHGKGTRLYLHTLLDPFSDWVDTQEVSEADQHYLAARLGAFICEYLIEVCSGQRVVKDDRIFLRVPISEGVVREFDPYEVAYGMAVHRKSLKVFLYGIRGH